MAEELKITSIDKAGRYKELLPQIKALVDGETDPVANMANICAALKYGMNFLWVGFYLVKGDELVLGPFQGPIACTRIAKGRGVCGTAWQKNEIIIVDDVEKFPGHIACSSLSRSEIVVPVYDSKRNVCAVLDVDSEALAAFDRIDEEWLKKITALFAF